MQCTYRFEEVRPLMRNGAICVSACTHLKIGAWCPIHCLVFCRKPNITLQIYGLQSQTLFVISPADVVQWSNSLAANSVACRSSTTTPLAVRCAPCGRIAMALDLCSGLKPLCAAAAATAVARGRRGPVSASRRHRLAPPRIPLVDHL